MLPDQKGARREEEKSQSNAYPYPLLFVPAADLISRDESSDTDPDRVVGKM